MEELSSFDTAGTTPPPNYTVSCYIGTEILAAPLRETRILLSEQYLPSNLIWFVILKWVKEEVVVPAISPILL